MATWTLEGFAGLASAMRAAQRAYFAERRKARPQGLTELLRAAQDAERAVDRALAEIAEYRPLFDPELRGDPS